MPTNLEIESKAILAKEDYKALLSKYKKYKNYKQINYYISSLELLEKVKEYGLRIRKKGRKYELTLKVTEKVGKTEINQEIKKKTLRKLKYLGKFPAGEVSYYLTLNKVCDVSKLYIIGKLVTIRKDIQISDSLFSIDCSKYNGIIDYEIECENSSKEKAENDLKKFLLENNITYQKSESGKLTRFLKSIH